MLRFQF